MGKFVSLAAAAAVAAAVSVGAATTAQASTLTLDFVKVSNNSSDNVASQLSVDVEDAGLGTGGYNQVLFTIWNNVGIASSITGIHFDDGTLLGMAEVQGFGGADFVQGGNPSHLPDGGDFNTTAEFYATSESPVSPSGINSATRYVEILFDLLSGRTFSDTIAALMQGGGDGGLRVGLRVQSHETDGKSDAYVSIPPAIPLPAGLVLFLSGLAGIGFLGRYKAKRQEPAIN